MIPRITMWCIAVFLMLSLKTAYGLLESRTPVVILPGFGNDSIDYIAPFGESENGLVAVLRRRGLDVSVLPVKRTEWIRVAGGLADPSFYSSKQLAEGIAYGWYVKRARESIEEAATRSGSKVLVVAHSAGGWLARAALAECSGSVDTLVTLGAPHFPPPDRSSCATRGALASVDNRFPGAAEQNVRYVTVAGDFAGNKGLEEVYSRRGEGSVERVSVTNYEAVGGRGDMRGDGVIPIEFAHLEGAKQVTLEGVGHSINEAGTTSPSKKWYGSEEVVDSWLEFCGIEREELNKFRSLMGNLYGLAGLAHLADCLLGDSVLLRQAGGLAFEDMIPVGKAAALVWCGAGPLAFLGSKAGGRAADLTLIFYGLIEVGGAGLLSDDACFKAVGVQAIVAASYFYSTGKLGIKKAERY